jgi:broad specificity phosphatase PhoE
MATLFLVRHGRAAAGFDGHLDPGLDDVGRAQANSTAAILAPLGPLAIYSSPLARARETAIPLSRHWAIEPVIEHRVAEIPSPTEDLQQRAVWLRAAMQGRWRSLDGTLQQWRRSLIDRLLEIPEDSVVFCHYIAINVAVGAATADDRLVCFRPDNGSITRIANNDRRLRVIELGRESDSLVN